MAETMESVRTPETQPMRCTGEKVTNEYLLVTYNDMDLPWGVPIPWERPNAVGILARSR